MNDYGNFSIRLGIRHALFSQSDAIIAASIQGVSKPEDHQADILLAIGSVIPPCLKQ